MIGSSFRGNLQLRPYGAASQVTTPLKGCGRRRSQWEVLKSRMRISSLKPSLDLFCQRPYTETERESGTPFSKLTANSTELMLDLKLKKLKVLQLVDQRG